MNVVKFLVRTLTCGAESNLESKLGASLPLVPSIGEHAAPLKNKFLVGIEWRTPLKDCEGKEFSWGLGTPESSANWVPSRRQLAPSVGEEHREGLQETPSQCWWPGQGEWGCAGKCTCVISSPVHELTGPQAVRWNSLIAHKMLWGSS